MHPSLKVINTHLEIDALRHHSQCSIIQIKDEKPKYQYSFFFLLLLNMLVTIAQL